MATVSDVAALALGLPEQQRALLAAHLLGSLPAVLADDDDGLAEALRRDADIEANPAAAINLEELRSQIRPHD